MRTCCALALVGLAVTPVVAQTYDTSLTGYDIPAHVSAVDGDAILVRSDGDDEPLEPNITLIEGDRLQTRLGRVEVLFADGTLLHVDHYTTIDFLRDDFARVLEGRVRVAVPRDRRVSYGRGADAFRLDAPAATIELQTGGDYRVEVAPNGDAEVTVLAGHAAVFNDRGDTRLVAGERVVATVDRAPSMPYYANAARADAFDRWSDARGRAYAAAVSLRYLPDELDTYAPVFDRHGRWDRHAEYGYVWYPTAPVGWQPYSRGRWRSYPRYGWTWIGHDPWAWPTHHFGRWGFSAGVWFWIPGRTWGPAWVAWGRSPGYVGWSPLGWDNRPIFIVGARRAHYTSSYPWCGWSFIRERDFGGRWRSGALVHGGGISAIAAAGIATSTVAPVSAGPRRAVPRSGTATTRVAVPRRSPGAGAGANTTVERAPGAAGAARPGRAVPRTPEPSNTPRAGRAIARQPDGETASPGRAVIRSAPPRDAADRNPEPARIVPRTGNSAGASTPATERGSSRVRSRRAPADTRAPAAGAGPRSAIQRAAPRDASPRAVAPPASGPRATTPRATSSPAARPAERGNTRSVRPRESAAGAGPMSAPAPTRRSAAPRVDGNRGAAREARPSPSAAPGGGKRAAAPRTSRPSGAGARPSTAQPRSDRRKPSGGDI